MKNKIGKSSTNLWIAVIAIALVVLAAAMAIPQIKTMFGVESSVIGSGNNVVVPSSVGCNINPAFVTSGINALVPNANVTPATFSYIANGVYRGSSYTPVQGASVSILSDPTGYLADVRNVDSVSCGNNGIDFSFKQYANATITIKQDPINGASALTNNVDGGAVNASSIAAGAYRTLPVIIQGNNQKSTGKMFMVVETPATSASNVSDVTLSCSNVAPVKVNSIPAQVSASNANSYRVAYELPALDNSGEYNCNVKISTQVGYTLAGGVRTSWYAQEQFVDTNGAITTGLFDSNGNAKYQDLQTYNFLLA